jgi:hypothetical protein
MQDSADDDSAAAAGGKGSRKRAKKKATPTTAPVTVTQIYRDVMSKAGRKPVGMYERINNGRNAHNARVMGALYSVGQVSSVANSQREPVFSRCQRETALDQQLLSFAG